MSNSVHEEIEEILSRMTLEDKIAYCTGANFWESKAMSQYGIPPFKMSDGPHGLRYQEASLGKNIISSFDLLYRYKL